VFVWSTFYKSKPAKGVFSKYILLYPFATDLSLDPKLHIQCYNCMHNFVKKSIWFCLTVVHWIRKTNFTHQSPDGVQFDVMKNIYFAGKKGKKIISDMKISRTHYQQYIIYISNLQLLSNIKYSIFVIFWKMCPGKTFVYYVFHRFSFSCHWKFSKNSSSSRHKRKKSPSITLSVTFR